jgi:hypothetical protein
VPVTGRVRHGGTVSEGHHFPVATPDRVAALSEQLIHVHQALRERLVSLRQYVAAGTGRGPPYPAGEDVLSHCLSFCAAIHAHHTGEDSQLLPALRAAAPGPAVVARELDGLAAILSSHFSYEERRIARALDTLAPDVWSANVFNPGEAPIRQGTQPRPPGRGPTCRGRPHTPTDLWRHPLCELVSPRGPCRLSRGRPGRDELPPGRPAPARATPSRVPAAGCRWWSLTGRSTSTPRGPSGRLAVVATPAYSRMRHWLLAIPP